MKNLLQENKKYIRKLVKYLFDNYKNIDWIFSKNKIPYFIANIDSEYSYTIKVFETYIEIKKNQVILTIEESKIKELYTLISKHTTISNKDILIEQNNMIKELLSMKWK